MNFNEAMNAAKAGKCVKRSGTKPLEYYAFQEGALYFVCRSIPPHRNIVETVRIDDAMAEDWEECIPPVTYDEKVKAYDELKKLLIGVDLLTVRRTPHMLQEVCTILGKIQES